MKNSYITLTEALLSLRSCSGRLLQVEGRLGAASNPAVAQAAMPEVRDVRFAVNAAMDALVEVQAELPEPTKGQIVAHYNPGTVDKPLHDCEMDELDKLKGLPGLRAKHAPLTLDPEAFLGVPGKGKSEAMPTAEEAVSTIKSILSMEEGPAKPEKYDQWVSSECMMLLNGLDLIDRVGNELALDLPQDKLDLMGRVLNDQRKRLTDALAKKLDKVVDHVNYQ